MSLKKKAIVSTMLMALSITPTVIPNSIVTPSIVMAAPASDVKASEAFEVNSKMECQKDLRLLMDGQMDICSM